MTLEVSHEGECHMTFFNDNIHWRVRRVILFGDRTHMHVAYCVYCIDPQGNSAIASIETSILASKPRPRQVPDALRAMLKEKPG